ncbi:MAG: phosphonate ABC transporter, permease protein PhnE [Bdellovibrionota bacterium]
MSTKARSNIKSLVFDSILLAYLFCVALVVLFQPTQEQQMADMGLHCLIALGTLVAGFAVTKVLNKFGVITLGLSVFEPKHDKLKREPKTWFKTFWGIQFIVTFVVTFVVATVLTRFSFYEIFDAEGYAGAVRIFTALVTPNWSVLPSGILAVIETIFMAFMATMVAIPIAFFMAFFCAKNIMGKSTTNMTIYFLLRTFLNVTRSIEPLIWAIIFSVWVGIGPFAGMLALMIHSVASLTKQYSEIIESVDNGPIEGIVATGANSVQAIWFGIVPQVVLPYISFTIYRWDINVRMATVIGLVGGGGIGTLLIQYQGQALWNEVGTLAFLIVLVVWSLDTASAYIREALK